ncbi:MAG: caspase family protein [Steroidobacteraceae bacterium]|nr:caspase family protein [Steroidobacteraceae bacterium]
MSEVEQERARQQRSARLAGVLAASTAACWTVWVGASVDAVSTRPRAPQADEMLVVDCLLPGQVRSLGQRSVYVSARRPARITARDCQIRGGEYVAYDRADLRSALAAWLPTAEQGDVEAQVIVGEVYERGLGVAPDFAAAARWYEIAAKAGNKRAQVNLGHLYEQGLGVVADARAALEWYARAAGRSAPVEIDVDAPIAPAAPSLDTAERERLGARAQQLEASLEVLRAELVAARQAVDASQSRAAVAEKTAAEERAARLVAEQSNAGDSARSEAALQRELAIRSEEAAALQGALSLARAEAATAATTAAQLAERERELAAQRATADRLGRELASATALAASRRQQIERLEAPVREQLLTGPELALIEPPVVPTRDIVPVAITSAGDRPVVGRVTAPAGLVSLTVNDSAATANELGVFVTSVAVAGGESPVRIVAVDRQGKRAELRFVLRSSAAEPPQSVAASGTRQIAAGVDFGSYHALLIGNNDYRYLPDLASPVNDVTDLARTLEQRYGFKTTVLLNADRYQVLSALNTLRETLTSRDNLLVYFAGHGELDEVNQRGHWLPVDAERDSTANWIPTTAVTDILNIMKAKQVLLVADSCYAGALTRSAMGRLGAGMTDAERLHWYRTMASKRSRTVLTSGGLAPVMDAGGGRHSVFAKALLEVLDANADTIDGQRLHREVAARVAYAAANLRFDQVPEYAPIRYAGHEAGEFFLVPRP